MVHPLHLHIVLSVVEEQINPASVSKCFLSPLAATTQYKIELATNLREDFTITFTEKAPLLVDSADKHFHI